MLSQSVDIQRIKLTQINPNPLFEKWLLEWIQQAEVEDSMRKHSLIKALDSLRKYPLMLKTGRDCSILDGFGTGICRMLDERLKKKENLVSEQRLDESLKGAMKKVAIRINQVNFAACLKTHDRRLYVFNYSGETTPIEENYGKARYITIPTRNG